MHDHYDLREIISKYHRGEPLTPEEQAILDAEVARLPSRKVWDRIRSHLESSRQAAVIPPWYTRWPAVAGAAAVLVVLAFGLYRYNQPAHSAAGATAMVQRVWKAVAPGHYYGEFEGPEGREVVDSAIGGQAKPYRVRLPDGSQVILSYGSSIRYAQGFGERKIVLSGEAHFEVVRDEQRPFRVEAGGTTVQVLGTQFDWMHYTGIPDAVTLLSGKVRLSRGTKQRDLSPGEQAVIREGNRVKVEVQRLARPEESVAWMERHSIVFDSVEMSTVIRRMAQYYGKGFYLEPGLPVERPVSGILDLERPLKDNLAPIGAMLNAQVYEHNGIIEVTK